MLCVRKVVHFVLKIFFFFSFSPLYYELTDSPPLFDLTMTKTEYDARGWQVMSSKNSNPHTFTARLSPPNPLTANARPETNEIPFALELEGFAGPHMVVAPLMWVLESCKPHFDLTDIAPQTNKDRKHLNT